MCVYQKLIMYGANVQAKQTRHIELYMCFFFSFFYVAICMQHQQLTPPKLANEINKNEAWSEWMCHMYLWVHGRQLHRSDIGGIGKLDGWVVLIIVLLHSTFVNWLILMSIKATLCDVRSSNSSLLFNMHCATTWYGGVVTVFMVLCVYACDVVCGGIPIVCGYIF